MKAEAPLLELRAESPASVCQCDVNVFSSVQSAVAQQQFLTKFSLSTRHDADKPDSTGSNFAHGGCILMWAKNKNARALRAC